MIPVNEPVLTGKEKEYLLQCIDTGWISSEGPFVTAFEEGFAEATGRKHAVALTNGTAAIDVAIEALGIGPGDEVILPSFTFISCIMQIIRAGATPVLVDSDPLTFNASPDAYLSRITPQTKAIMFVHIYGLPVDMEPVIEVARTKGIAMIEDAAEVIGQTYRGRPCGSFGDISTFSFYPNKHVTTGEGGMVLTDDDALAETARSLRNLCFQPRQRFVHDRLGWNLRMTNMQAALGVAQLERLSETVERKRYIGKRYNQLLEGLPGVQLPVKATNYAENIYWVYPLVLDRDHALDAVDMMAKLGEKKIGTRPFFYPMHKQPVFMEMGLFKNDDHPVSEHLARKGFYIPSGLAITDAQIETVAETLWSLLG
jgi:perosamine synthetase